MRLAEKLSEEATRK